MYRYFVVDAFTATPLEGNQVAVFPDAAGYSSEQMQRLAREMNFSESTFVLPAKGEGDANVRIFTPRRELPFAGHPVLGTAFVVGDALALNTVRLETGLGVIPVELQRDDGRIVSGCMQQAIPESASLRARARAAAGAWRGAIWASGGGVSERPVSCLRRAGEQGGGRWPQTRFRGADRLGDYPRTVWACCWSWWRRRYHRSALASWMSPR